jgi:TetR/AcrR family transcriptional regulator of autoinduction and epiphytic fitness
MMTDVPSRRAAAKRDQIRGAALPLFVRDGFERTTTDAIAAAAGISKQTLYRYYPAKEDLLADILNDLSVQNFWSDAPPAPRPIRTREAFEAALMGVARGIVQHATDPTFLGLERVLIAEIPRFPHLARRFREAVTTPGFGIVASLLQQAHDAAILAAPPSDAAVRSFLGPLLSYIYLDGLLAPAEDWRQPEAAEVAALVHLFVDAVIAH